MFLPCRKETPTFILFHGVRSGMFSEKQARNAQGTLQVKIAGPFTSEFFNFQYLTCFRLNYRHFQISNLTLFKKNLFFGSKMGGRLIHRIDLFTGKYGKCTIPSMDCLTPGDAHKSCKLFKQICCL